MAKSAVTNTPHTPVPSPQPAAAGPTGSSSAQSSTHAHHVVINVVIPSLLLVAAGCAVWLLGTVEPAKRPDPDFTRVGRLKALPPVRVERLVSLQDSGTRLQLETDGVVVPYREARVAAEVAGRVIFKDDQCEAGSFVRQGQLLMRIDPTDYELETQRLTRLQEQEYEALREIDQEMTNTQRLIEVAQQDVELQQKEVDRQNSLPAGFASRAEIDQANRALLAARQQLVNVENQLELLRKRRVRLEASERLAATQLKAAEVNLQRTEIRAPIDGVIVSEDADLNTFVPRGNTLVTIEDTSKVDVATNLRMDQLHWVLDQQGQRVDPSARGYDLPETPALIEYELSGRDNLVYRWKGKLLSYNGIGLDPNTRTVPVRVVVDNPTQYVDEEGNPTSDSNVTALVRGMYVRVKLLITPQTSLVVIPARALQPGNRVYHFIPDESVLDVSTQTVANRSDTDDLQLTATTAADEDDQQDTAAIPPATGDEVSPEEATGQSVDDAFDPDQWAAGRVVLRRRITPVDSLTVNSSDDTQDESSGAETNSEFAGANRMWVCEVPDGTLTGGSYVVVSPLGGLDDGQMPVRADRSGMQEDTTQRGVTPSSNTAPSVAPQPSDREDA